MVEVPASWQRLILEIREHDPKAVIAGGAIRDLILGRRPKDIDIFGSVDVGLRPTSLILNWSPYDEEPNGSFKIKAMSNHKVRGIVQQVQRILLIEDLGPLELIESFDFGICMAAYDGKEIIRSRHFDHDVEHKVFTLRHCRNLVKSKARWKRITKRYRFWYGKRWPMKLSGKATLDIMLQKLEAKGRLVPKREFHYF